MNEMVRETLQDAYVLHYRRYRETSIVADIFSRNFGKLSVIAKGARRNRSKFSCILQPFRHLKLSWCGKSDLLTLTDAEMIAPLRQLTGSNLYCGFYINELLYHFLYKHDPHVDLFSAYQEVLALIENSDSAEKPLRYFELLLLEQIGYGLQIRYEGDSERPIDPEKSYDYVIGKGPVATTSEIGSIRGSALIALQWRNLSDCANELREAKLFLRRVIDFHLGGKSLKSRSLFQHYKNPTMLLAKENSVPSSLPDN